jgi:hypothetical protein
MKHFIPFAGVPIGWLFGHGLFTGSTPGNRVIFGLLAGGFLFFIIGMWVWTPHHSPRDMTFSFFQDDQPPWNPQQWQYNQQVQQQWLNQQHQQHLREQARMGWLEGNRDYPPSDWYGY